MIKNKHKSGINISNSPKIMINSGKLYLGISYPFTEVELKNLFNFSYKNHQGRNNINTR
jgi:hypothetical protein